MLAEGLMTEESVIQWQGLSIAGFWAASGYFFQAEYPVMLPEDLAHYSNLQNKVLSMVKSKQILS